MVQFNFSERTIKAKVVYYGPAQSGKTTNLEQIHRLTDPAGQNRLISLNTAQDRTLFFDLLPFSLGAVSGYDFKIQLYTVPGQVQYNATRRVVLAGADAVVFVADSRRPAAKENQAAFENMKVNLLANRLVPEKVPLVVQYNKMEFNDAQWGPYAKKVSNNRVTVEEAPIQILVPGHPLFTAPNRITADDWGGWVQERGLYFLAEEGDPRYQDLLASEDPWEYNKGVKKGLLVEARYGKGRWVYVGLVLWRQLPSGTEGAYRLFANLISLGRPALTAKPPKPLAVER